MIIAVAGDQVLEFAAEAAARGARALLVLPPGSAHESPPRSAHDGDASRLRKDRLLEIVRDAGLRMVGPGSLGVVNTAAGVSLNATFTGAGVRAGALAIGSPSGAVGIALLGHAAARRLGVSMFASLGQHADVSTNDLLESWEQDERTAAVMLYVESFGNPERFTRIARRVSRSIDIERAVGVAAEIGAPIALKADFAAPAHASDIDAVLLGLEGEPAVQSGWRELERRVQAAGREWTGAILQRRIAPGGAELRSLHDRRMRRARHAIAHRAPPQGRPGQDVVITCRCRR